MLKAILGTAALGLSLYEMWKANKPVMGDLQLDEEANEQVNDLGVAQGIPAPSGGFTPALGPVQWIQQYPQYRQQRTYAWGPPNWGWY